MAQIDCSYVVLSWLSEMCVWEYLYFLRGKQTWALILAESAAYTVFHNLQDQMGPITARKLLPPGERQKMHFSAISWNYNHSNKVWLKVFVYSC